MKYGFLIIIGMLIATSFQSQSAMAGDGTKGGDTFKINGRTRLRDLVDKSNCFWVHTDEFVKDVPEFEKILKRVETMHWYLAHALRQESRATGICKIEGAIKNIQTDDLDGLTYYQLPGKKSQMAIRLNDDIYLSLTGFKPGPDSMPPEDQGYAVVHELMHTFIPDDTAMRNTKVKSMTSIIQQDLATESFKFQMEKNGLVVHRNLKDLEQYKEDILRMTDPKLSFNERAISARKVMPIQNLLYAGDQKVIAELLDTKSQEEADARLSALVGQITSEAEYYKFASLYPNLIINKAYNFVDYAFVKGMAQLGLKIRSDRVAAGNWSLQNQQFAIKTAITADLPEAVASLYKGGNIPLNSVLVSNQNGLQIAAEAQSMKTLDLFLRQSQIVVNGLNLLSLSLRNGEDKEINPEAFKKI